MMNRIFFFALFCLAAETAYSEVCDDVEIVSRASWGARSPSYIKGLLPIPLQHVFISHTVTAQCNDIDSCIKSVKSMQRYHMDHLGWSDVGYSFIIGGDGRVYEAAGWRNVSIHTKGWNNSSLGVAFIGDYRYTEPTSEMLRAAKALIVCGTQQGFLSENCEIHGSRDGTCTVSPGDALYNVIKKWTGFKGGRLPGYTC